MDREKVIKDLDELYGLIYQSNVDGEILGSLHDAVTLLKEQEAVEPKKVKGYNPPMYTLYEYECKECKTPMMTKQPFCMGCGRKVKWE